MREQAVSGIQEKFIKTKITDFIKQQIDAGATLIFEDPAEHFGSTAISNILIRCREISDPAFRVYTVLKSYAYGEKHHRFPGQETIAKWIGKDRKTVNRLLGELREKELIDWIQVGLNSPNVYIIKRVPQRYLDEYIAFDQELKNMKIRKPLKTPDVPKMRHPENALDVSKMGLPDVPKMGHKEYKNKQYVVVGELQNLGNSEQDQEREGLYDQQIPNPITEENIQELIQQVKGIAGATVSASFAREILRGHSQEVISTALADLKAQVDRGMEFTSGVGAWLRAWLQRNYEPDQKPPQVIIKDGKSYRRGSSKIVKASNSGTSEQDAKKKAFIRSLYI